MSKGQSAIVAVSSDDIAYTDIVNVLGVPTFNPRTKIDIENSTFGDAADTFEVGSYTQALAFDLKYVKSAAGLTEIFDSLDADTVYYWRMRPITGTGEREHVFQGYVTDMSQPFDRNGVQTISITIRSTGATTTSTQ